MGDTAQLGQRSVKLIRNLVQSILRNKGIDPASSLDCDRCQIVFSAPFENLGLWILHALTRKKVA